MDKPLDLNGVKVYTKADVIDAMNLIGQDVYMSDDADFENYYKYKLIGIQFEEDSSYAFIGSDDCQRIIYKYLILEKDAKFKEEKEKKLRPFKDIKEFFEETGLDLGKVITYRPKESNAKIKAIVVGAIEYIESQFPEKDLISIQFSNKSYSPDELLKYFVYLDPQTNKWHPFGIEE